MTPMLRVRALASCALATGLTVVAGCGDNGTTTVSADHPTVSVDADKGEVSAQTDDGTVSAGQALPDGFPSDDVPLIDAKVITGVRGAPGGEFVWSVVLQASRSIDDLTAEVRMDFASAGYANGQANEMGDVTVLQFKSAAYVVGVTMARTGESVTVTYVVQTPS